MTGGVRLVRLAGVLVQLLAGLDQDSPSGIDMPLAVR
jgi:hypothetical protein